MNTPEHGARQAGFFDGLYERIKQNVPHPFHTWYLKGYLRGLKVRKSFTEENDDEARTR